MFKSRIDENLKAEEIGGPENEDVCYEIVKENTSGEKPLTLEEARKLVERNYFLNKRDLSERFSDIFGTNSDALFKQYIGSGDVEENVDGNYDRIHRFGDESSTDEEGPAYVGRGIGADRRRKGDGDGPDIDEDLPLDDEDDISGTIHSTNCRPLGKDRAMPMTNYGKGPPPFWSNVFDDSSSGEE